MKVYIDGNYYDRENALISVFDHGLLYGDGVFEGIRIYNNTVFKLREHINRLYMSAQAILLEIPLQREELEQAVLKTVEINKKENGYIRLIVTRGQGTLGIDPRSCTKPTVIIIAGDIQLYPEEYYRKGIEIITASSRRIPSDSLDPRIKSLNYLNNILAKIEARQAGCLEAVMLNRDGFIAECTGDNIFMAKNNRIFYPSPYHGSLDGITMRTVIELAGSNGIEVQSSTLTRYDLYTSEECFMTGTGAEIVPVVRIDGRTIGSGKPGQITITITNAFKALVNDT